MDKKSEKNMKSAPTIVILGGGMITHIQILPTIYYLRREGVFGDLHICAINKEPLLVLQNDEKLNNAFPNQSFIPHPDPEKVKSDEKFPDLYKDVLKGIPKHSVVIVALPDHMHYKAVMEALNNDHHVCCVKPLVLKYSEAEEIASLAYKKGLLVGIEYHKRFDYRIMMARKSYQSGQLGEFRLAQAHLHEKYYYRYSNFQNWCTCENSDMFSYIGCHYVDLIAFITGLKPVSVSAYGIVDTYPNGNKGYLWTDGRVIWENGACLECCQCSRLSQ